MQNKYQDRTKRLLENKNTDQFYQSKIQLNSPGSQKFKSNLRKISSDKEMVTKNIKKIDNYKSNEKVIKTLNSKSNSCTDENSDEISSFDEKLYNTNGDNKLFLHFQKKGFEDTANEIAMLDQIKLGVSEYFNKADSSRSRSKKSRSRKSASCKKGNRRPSIGFSSLDSKESKKSKSKKVFLVKRESQSVKRKVVNNYLDQSDSKVTSEVKDTPTKLKKIDNVLLDLKLPEIKKNTLNEKNFFEQKKKNSILSENIDSRQNTERNRSASVKYKKKIIVKKDNEVESPLKSPSIYKSEKKLTKIDSKNPGISQIEEDMRSVLDTIATNLRKNDTNFTERSDKSEDSSDKVFSNSRNKEFS